ncbi:AI-2E family transporter [Aquibium oceanicum]|uniref:AI-2E family transporter n=1 Tax=Aquibium oceanicum TaxID=1670800 RepID=A0A1L3SX95_9HYPH|nr:AI-2E family transporter [Aquibium oceanicum]APH74039.1 AI-2E family transporter [Aquibium oceanicum]
MQSRLPEKPSTRRLPPKSNIELLISKSAEVAAIAVGVVAVVFALDAAEFVLAPVVTAIVVGLMLGPVATSLERHGVPATVSAGAVVILFLVILAIAAAALAAPLSTWMSRGPQIWQELQIHLSQLREPLATLQDLRDQLRSTVGGEGVTVSVEEESAMESVATLAPAIVGQVLLFLASLYFFVATRYQTRHSILQVCVSRKLRWRVAHIFRDVERSVSRYLLSISIINVGLGVAVAIAMLAIGMPSPALWGALAGLLNFVVYLGPAVMAVILFAVGLTQFDTLGGSLVPPLVYLALNLIEAQFVTPHVIGRAMTMNPFVVILSIAFWIWIWGPLGGFIAIPVLLVLYSIAANIIPGIAWIPEERTVVMRPADPRNVRR